MTPGLSHRSLGLLIFTLALLALGAGLLLRTPSEGPGENATGPRFDAQAHRGGRGDFPGNTLPAFRHALATGVTTLEMDVQLTADGVPVVHHDSRLDPARTRGPDGTWIAPPGPAIGTLTLAELQRYDVGAAKPGSADAERFPGQAALDGVRVPTLEAVIALGERRSGGRVRYNIETKVTPRDDPAAAGTVAAAILKTVRAAGTVSRTTVQSFDWRALSYVRDHAPEVARAYLTAERDWLDTVGRGQPRTSPWLDGIDVDAHEASLPQAIAAAETPEGEAYTAKPPWRIVWSPYFRDLRPPDLARARALGLKVVVWTPNRAETIGSLIDDGVDGIITDYPGRLRQALRARGRPLPRAYAAD